MVIFTTTNTITIKEGNTLVAHRRARSGEPFVNTGFIEVDAGLYSIVFCNGESDDDDDDDPATVTVTTQPFAASGKKEDTWIYGAVYKDYLVQASVGSIGQQAALRQIPGPVEPPEFPWSSGNINFNQNTVFIEARSDAPAVVVAPAPTPGSTPTPKDDGISDSVYGRFNGTPANDSGVFSNDFTDQHTGSEGKMFGSVTDRDNLFIMVADAKDDDDGLLLRATGGVGGTAKLDCVTQTFS